MTTRATSPRALPRTRVSHIRGGVSCGCVRSECNGSPRRAAHAAGGIQILAAWMLVLVVLAPFLWAARASDTLQTIVGVESSPEATGTDEASSPGVGVESTGRTTDATQPPDPVADADSLRKFLEERVRSDPLDFIAHNRLASAYLKLMRDSGDLVWLNRAAAEAKASLASVPAPRNPGGLAALALTQFEGHHFSEALESAEHAYAIDPRNTSALATIGDAQLELGNYAEAGTVYARLAADGESPPVLAREARLAELQGDTSKALELLTRAGDSDGWYRIRRGELLFRRGELDQAEAEYLAAPASFAQIDHLAELRGAQGRYDEAIALYRQLIDRVPRAETLHYLGDLYQFIGKTEEAAAWHERALAAYLHSIEEGNAHYYHHLASFYSDCVESPVDALRWARKDLEIRHSIYAWDTLAWALYKNGDFTGAADAMTKALALGTLDAHLLHHGGMIFSRAGDLTKGRALLQQTVAVNPAYPRFHVHR